MRFSKLFSILGVTAMTQALVHQPFVPEFSTAVANPGIPLIYNLTTLQTLEGVSFWTSSFITLEDGHQYLVVVHALINGAPSLFRSSILDIGNPNNYYTNVTYIDSPATTYENRFNITGPNFDFLSTTADSISGMHTSMTTPDYSYDMTLNASSKPLLNMGGNLWEFGTGNSTEIGIPACQTSGTITLNGTTATIDPANSFTWYDRQWGPGMPSGNWTWFELNFPSGLRVSAWAIDSSTPLVGTQRRFATVRSAGGDVTQILPFSFEADYTDAYTSPASNLTYPQRWTVRFAESDDELVLQSARPDQEIRGPRGDFAFEGYMTANGTFMGQNSAVGIVELVWNL